jgi:hypothetical protein
MKNNFLDLLNERLFEFDNQLDVIGIAKHNIFIVGAPRSGTTLLSQLFSGCTSAGYPNNLMAAFWNAPITGALLSKKWTEDKIFTGINKFGQTLDFREPHEFGAYWRSHLLMESMDQPDRASNKLINWKNLKNSLQDISKVFANPVVYKALHLSWFIHETNKILPESKWIWISRDTLDNAMSILNLRRFLHNDIRIWASSKPKGIEKYCIGNPYLEVVAQVELINQWIDSQLKNENKDNWISLSLESLVESPITIFDKVASWSGVEVLDKNLKLASKIIHAEKFEKNQEYQKIKDAYKDFQKRMKINLYE